MSDRMTKKRASALWSAISRGIDEMEADIDDGGEAYTQDEFNAAEKAASIFYSRYVKEKS